MPRANDRVAEALAELADLLAISGGDPFRVRAYEKAGRAISAYAMDVSDLDEVALRSIPAVGSHIAAKITALLQSGHLAELDDLRAQVPAGLRSLLAVPGLGPRHARQVYDELHVTSIPELLDSLHRKELCTLKGWGPTSEARLAKAIEQYQASGGRLQLGVALSLADELVATLGERSDVDQVTYAGSLRRMCDTIGDIDLLAASREPESVMDAFSTLPQLSSILARGATKAVGLTTAGVHVDLRVVNPDCYGAALLYFTGSQAHNIHLRRVAQRQGFKLSEYGLERADTGKVVASRTEEAIYEALGMSVIPPALREDRGEIQAAIDHHLPSLVGLDDLRGDLHTHTSLTDGVDSLEDMVSAAKERGYRYLAITDHAPLLYMQRMTKEKALAQRAELSKLQPAAGLTLLHGSELNIQPDGSLDWDDEFLGTFDLLVASIHSAFAMPRDEMTVRLIRAIEHPMVNVIGHPSARSIGHRPPIEFDTHAVFDAAARCGTALEVNGWPDRLDLDDQLCRSAVEHGVVLAISSDAHATRHLSNVRYGVATAQRGWVTAASVINTWPLHRLRRFLEKAKRTGH